MEYQYEIMISEPVECGSGVNRLDSACYLTTQSTGDWEETEAQCAAAGGHLATIVSQHTQDFLKDFLNDIR